MFRLLFFMTSVSINKNEINYTFDESLLNNEQLTPVRVLLYTFIVMSKLLK